MSVHIPARRLLASAAIALGLTVAAPVPWAAADTARSQQFYNDAVQQLRSGNVNAAVIQLRNAVQQDGRNLAARRMLGELSLAGGDYESAEKELRRVYEAAPDDAVEVLLARALLALQRPEDVLTLVKPDAGTPEQRQQKLLVTGDAQFALGHGEAAAAAYTQAQALGPEAPGPHLGLGRLALALGNLDAAEDQARLITERSPELVEGWLLAADIAGRRGQTAAAATALGRATAIAPQDPRVLLGVAQNRLQSGDLDGADGSIQQVLQRDPNNLLARYLRATVQLARGQYAEANRTFTPIEDALRDYPPAMLLDGLIKYNTQQYAQAERALARYATVVPQNVAARRALAAVQLRAGNPRSAIEGLQALLAEHPDDVAALQLLAGAQMRLGDHNAAAATYERLARTASPAAAQQARGALALLGIGGDALAGEPEAAPGDEVSQGILLALEYLRTGEADAALRKVEELRAAQPDNPILLNLEGGAYLAKGDRGAARHSFEAALRVDPEFLSALDNLDQLDTQAGDRQAIERRLRDLLARAPSSEPLILRLAELLDRSGRTDEAVALLEAERQELGTAIALRQALAGLYLRRGEPAKVAALGDELMAQAGGDPAAVRLAGLAYLDGQQPDKAIEAFRRLVTLTPGSVDSQIQLAQVLVATGRLQQAQPILEAVHAAHPENAPAVFGLIELALRADDPDRALALADSLADHDRVSAAQLRANVLLRTGRAAEAVQAIAAAFARDPVPALALDLYRVRRAAGQQAAAIAGLRDWLAGHPGDRAARTALAQGLLEAGDHAGAAAEYQTLLAADPDNPMLLNNLAWVKGESGAAGALDDARRAYALAPNSPDIADTLGWLLVKGNQPGEGLDLLRKAAAAAPANPDIQYHLAYALSATGDRAQAKGILERLVAGNDSFGGKDEAAALLRQLQN